MSLLLSNSNNIDCSVRSGYAGKGFFEDEIIIGDYFIHNDDFEKIIYYFMTNTDLEENDIRLRIKENIEKIKFVPGFNNGLRMEI